MDGIRSRYRPACLRHTSSDSSRLLGGPSCAVGADSPLDHDLVLDLVAFAAIHLEPFFFTARGSKLSFIDLVIVRRLTFRHSHATLLKVAPSSHLTQECSQRRPTRL